MTHCLATSDGHEDVLAIELTLDDVMRDLEPALAGLSGEKVPQIS